ncbi:AI-2E family transporter [Oligoflexus tunisiensis]|uniref:AI-2E family transporter n=1 Tax=Oligoflexus tunisiensis TaxID=708132 RepID=UPI00114D0DB3|nr:AI-2E family transporter [Oligoflexus tunisiensis]
MKDLYGPHLWQIRMVRDIFLIAVIVAFFGFVKWLWPIFMPIFVALVLAYLFNPTLHKAKARWNWSRPLTAGMIIAAATLLLVAFFIWLWPIAAEQTQALAEKLPQYINTLAERSNIQDLNAEFQKWISSKQGESGVDLAKEVLSRTGRAYEWIKKIIGATSYAALLFLLIPLYFFFFAWRFDAMVEYLDRFIPQSRKERVEHIIKRMDQATATFFRGRVLVSLIVAGLYSVGWALADVPYWFILGMLAGLLNIIPFASGVLWPVAVLVKYLESLGAGGDASLVAILVWPSVVFFVVQFLEGWVLSPWVQSDQLDMSAATVLIVVFIGGEIAGFFGLLLALPIAACLKIFYEEVIEPQILRWANST